MSLGPWYNMKRFRVNAKVLGFFIVEVEHHDLIGDTMSMILRLSPFNLNKFYTFFLNERAKHGGP